MTNVRKVSYAITFNGRKLELDRPVSVLELLALGKVRVPEEILISINDRFLLCQEFEFTYLKPGDIVEMRHFIWGM